MTEQKIVWAAPSSSPDVAADVVLEASALVAPVHGREQVMALMDAASAYYTRLDFSRKTTDGARTYLEWDATGAGGEDMSGVTVLTRNDDGQLTHVAIHHRPLRAAMAFSAEMGRRMAGIITAEHFLES